MRRDPSKTTLTPEITTGALAGTPIPQTHSHPHHITCTTIEEDWGTFPQDMVQNLRSDC